MLVAAAGGRRMLRPIAMFGLLTILAALTEGAGLVLLIPMLSTLDAAPGSAAMPGRLGELLAALGVPLQLEPLLAGFVLLVAARAALGAARDLAGLRFEAAVVDGLRHTAWAALLRCNWRTLSGLRQTDASSLLVSSIERIGYGVRQMVSLLAGLATLGSLALAGMAIAPGVVLLAIAGGGAVLFAYRRLRRRASALGVELGEAHQRVHAHLIESLGAIRLIKGFGREEAAVADLDAAFARTRRAELDYARSVGLARSGFQSGGAILLALLVWAAVRQWGLDATAVIPTVALFARALPLLGTVQDSWQNWAHARPALLEAAALIQHAQAGAETGGAPLSLPPGPVAITVCAVSVHHDGRDRPALDRVSFDLPAGSITALTGPSGAGKSTLADVLCGMIAPDEGALTVAGLPLTDVRRRAWRDRVAYVQQEPVLFHASVRDNLLWGAPSATEQALIEALRAASAGFVLDLPQGMDTVVGDRGARLSGGERQRIALARGLLRAPQLLVLDEVTSALDPTNEAAVAQAIAGLRGQLTIVIIGHRGALAAVADRRIALEGGRLVTTSIPVGD